MNPAPQSYDNQAEARSEDKRGAFWKGEIARAKDRNKIWWNRSRRIEARFLAEAPDDSEPDSKVNILHSNTVVRCAAIYQTPPRPDVRRRFSEAKAQEGEPPELYQQRRMRDKLMSSVADVLERALAWNLDDYDIDEQFRPVIQDYALAGRGAARVRYTIEKGEADEIVAQTCRIEWLYREDVLIGPARIWSDVPWVAFRHDLTEEQVAELLTDSTDRVMRARVLDDLKFTDEKAEGDSAQDKDAHQTAIKRASVWEVWDKETRSVLWVSSDSGDGIIATVPDPYNLAAFFPMPRPLQAASSTASMTPLPPFVVYQDLANELDTITTRIDKITAMIKVRGLYDSSIGDDLQGLLELDDGELMPAQNAARLADKGGLSAALFTLPLNELVQVLDRLYIARDQAKALIYEVSGISDILRGSSDPNETASAQKIKAQFGTMRFDEEKREVARFARDLMRLKAELIAERYDAQVLQQITGVPVSEAMVAVLRNDKTRGYRIDIETDSTVAVDSAAEQEAVGKLFESLTRMVGALGPMVESGKIDDAVLSEMLRMGVRPFRHGRQIEAMLDEMEAQRGAEAEQPAAPPQPSPEELRAQAATAKAQSDAAADQARAAATMQELQFKAQQAQAKNAADTQMMNAKHEAAMQELQAQAQLAQMEHQHRMAEMQARMQEMQARMMADRARPRAEAGGQREGGPPPAVAAGRQAEAWGKQA